MLEQEFNAVLDWLEDNLGGKYPPRRRAAIATQIGGYVDVLRADWEEVGRIANDGGQRGLPTAAQLRDRLHSVASARRERSNEEYKRREEVATRTMLEKPGKNWAGEIIKALGGGNVRENLAGVTREIEQKTEAAKVKEGQGT